MKIAEKAQSVYSSAKCRVVIPRRLRGILKRKSGEKPLAEQMAKYKRAEKELEEVKYARSTGSR